MSFFQSSSSFYSQVFSLLLQFFIILPLPNNHLFASSSFPLYSPYMFFPACPSSSSTSCSIRPFISSFFHCLPPNSVVLYAHSASPPASGPSVVLLLGGGWADFPGSLGSGSSRAQSHVVRRGAGLVWPGPGRVAQGFVRHPAARLERWATEVWTILTAWLSVLPTVHLSGINSLSSVRHPLSFDP